MGALKDRAKAQSKFLLLDKGESAVVQYVGWKSAADPRDPTKEVTIYEFRENGVQKFWTNSSSKIMLKLDTANPMEYVRITRGKSINKAGEEDPEKSVYSLDILGDKPPAPGQTTTAAPIASPGASGGPTSTPPDGFLDMPDPFAQPAA